jgi:hypothetical protein
MRHSRIKMGFDPAFVAEATSAFVGDEMPPRRTTASAE